MGVINVCAAGLTNIGSLACSKNNPFLDAVALIFTTSGFQFDTFVDFATEAKWTDGVKAKNVYPLLDIVEIEDGSEESQYYESPGGKRTPRRLGNYKHMYNFNKGLEVHKALQSFRNKDLRVFGVDAAGNITGYSPNGTIVKGFSIGMINPEKMKSAGQDNTPAFTPLAVDLKDAKQWNENGVYINPTWDAASMVAVSDVVISVVSSIATLIVLKVAYFEGIAPDGSNDFIGAAGIVEGDFEFVTTAPTGGSTMVDNLDGTYNFPGAGMVTGSVNLKTPATASSGGAPIESTGAAVITIA